MACAVLVGMFNLYAFFAALIVILDLPSCFESCLVSDGAEVRAFEENAARLLVRVTHVLAYAVWLSTARFAWYQALCRYTSVKMKNVW